jgi:hypothetical protein
VSPRWFPKCNPGPKAKKTYYGHYFLSLRLEAKLGSEPEMLSKS